MRRTFGAPRKLDSIASRFRSTFRAKKLRVSRISSGFKYRPLDNLSVGAIGDDF
jgi:hypothetical protein